MSRFRLGLMGAMLVVGLAFGLVGSLSSVGADEPKAGSDIGREILLSPKDLAVKVLRSSDNNDTNCYVAHDMSNELYRIKTNDHFAVDLERGQWFFAVLKHKVRMDDPVQEILANRYDLHVHTASDEYRQRFSKLDPVIDLDVSTHILKTYYVATPYTGTHTFSFEPQTHGNEDLYYLVQVQRRYTNNFHSLNCSTLLGMPTMQSTVVSITSQSPNMSFERD